MSKESFRNGVFRHKANVARAIGRMLGDLDYRVIMHDNSKLEAPEAEGYQRIHEQIQGTKFGTPEHRNILLRNRGAIYHHKKVNRHHPEYFENGIEGMNLPDVIEMFCDWYAASQRTTGGDFGSSFEICCKRFNVSGQLRSILYNTMKEYGWDGKTEPQEEETSGSPTLATNETGTELQDPTQSPDSRRSSAGEYY